MRSIGLFLFVSLFGFITLTNAQNGSAGQPFTSLGQAQNVASDGVYYFSLSGTTFSTYVRVGGWVQVAIDFDSGVGNLPQSNALTNTVRGILTPTALSKLGSATVTRLLTSNGQLDVQNSMPGIVTRIVNNQTLLAVPADNADNGGNWTGTNTLATQFTNFGNTTAYGLHSNFFHAGNNGDGIHWIPFFNMQQIKTSAGEIPNGAYFQLLVRAPMVAVVVGPTINTQPSTTAQNLCINSAANALSVSATSPNGSAITYQWYSNTNASNSNGTAIGGATSSTYTPPSNVVGTKYYYVICTNNQGSTTSNVSAGITVQGTSVGGTANSNQTVCGGSSPANLTLTSNTGTIQWQSSTDNINFNNIAGATSTTLTSGQMGAINATTYYRALVTNGSCAAATSNTIIINISSSPTLSSTTGASRCGTGTVTLQATAAAGTINWYAASTGGASLGNGTSYTTPSINATTTYYADVTNNGCTSTPRTAVVATVNAAPPTPTITQSGCGVLTLGNYSGGNALDFGQFNSSSYVTIPASLNTVFNTNNVTLEGWFKFDLNSTGFPMLIGEAYVGDGKITFCMHKQGNNINAGFYNNAWTVVTSSSTIQYNTWMHIAATYDQTSIKIYINGNLDATLNANAALPTGSESWYIGKRWDSNDVFRGVMDEIRVWNVARTQAQIQASMNTTVPTNSAGLRAYYKLDESTGTSTADATGNGYNGTLTNGSTWQVPSTSVLAGPATTILWSPTNQTTSVITAANSGTYSAVVTTAAGCQSAPVSAVVSIGVTASSNQTICSGTSPANLTLTGSATTIQWQSSTDNINFTNIAGATSATLTAGQMGNLNTTTYYRANVTNTGCAASTSNTVTITVNTTPTFTSTTGASICGTGTVTLQAATATGTINWYAALTGGASLGTGTSYTTPSINATTTYYADVTNNGCTSTPRTAVVATVNAAPPTPTITQTGCGTLSIGNLSSNALDLGVYNSSKYVTIPATLNSTINTNNITLEGWFYFTSLVPNTNYLPMLIGEAYNIDANITFCMHRQGNTIIAGFYNGGWQAASSSTLIPINTWIHIAATYDQNQIKLYFNGVLNASFNSNQPLPISNNQPWYLGKRWDHLETLGGAMDEIRIWNVARTQAQIQASMNSTVPTNSVGLRAYYKLDESTGNTASDATGNGYDGTLNNGPTWQVPSTSPLNTNGNNYTYLWSPGGQTTSSITPVTSGTYSAVVTNAAGCQSASISSSIIVGVTASSNQTICSGTAPANLTLSGSTTTVQWQSSTDNITFTNIAGATSTTLTSAQMGTLNSTRYYRATYTNGACPSSTSTTVTITVNPTPSFTNTTGASICGGPSVSTLQASAAAGTINWYAALTGGASLGTGTSYTTPSIAATTTYYVDVTNNGCTSTPRTAVVATVNTLPLAVSNASGAIDYLVVGGGGGGGFDGAGGGGGGQVKMGSTTLSSGTFTVTIGNGGANATSYGSQASNGGTTTLSLPTPIVSIGGGGGGSKGANGATGGNGGGGGHSNYVGAAGAVGGFAGGNANGDGGGGGGGAGTAGATGSAGRNGGNGVSSSISGSATYYGGGGGGGSYGNSGIGLGGLGGAGRGGLGLSPLATAGAANTGGGGGGAGEAVNNPGKSGGSGVVIVRYAGAQNGTGGIITTAGGFTIHTFNSNGSFVFNGVSSSAVVPHMSSCGASAITFTGTSLGAGITLDWYDAATGGNLLSQGTTTFTTPVISTTTTYYVAARNTSTGCVSATRTAVVATINAIPTISSTTGASVCVSGTVTLQATTAAGTINWYAASTGGASLGTGTSFTTPNINTTTTYYVDVTSNGCTSAPRTAVVATVNALPTFTSTTGASICGTGTATLQAAAAAGTINWYAASTGGASLGTGTSFTTPSIASTTTYYAAVTNNGCTSNPRTAVVATVNSIPTITTSTGATICVSGTGTLQAAAAAGTINWYAALTGGASLGTGTSYVTPNIATTTTYFADVTNNGCTSSPRTSIVATVIPSSSASSNQTVCPGLLPSAITLTSYSGTIQWQTSSNNSTFTNIAGQTSATLPANAIGIMAGTKYIRAMVTNGACVTPSNVVTLSPANVNVLTPLTASSYVWNGQSSSDWGTLSNWYSYNGTSLVPAATLPGSTANTIIPANTGCILTQPTLSSGAIIINSLVLETGSQLTQSGGTLLLYTNFVKNGNLNSTGGLINFYGPTAATISGIGAVQFTKMRVNKLAGATLTLQIPVTVSDSLTMIAGNIYTTTNNLLTLGLNSNTPGKLVYTNGTIVGPFKRFFANAAVSGLAGRFPVGTATYNRYAEFSFASSPGVDQSLTVQYVAGTPNQAGSPLYNGLPLIASGSLMQNYSADGYWNVIPTNNDYTSSINSTPHEVTLFANNLTGMQTAQVCRIIKSAGSNTAAQHHVAWQACGTHTAINGAANPQAFLISSTASQGFSWFNIGTPNSQALPVEFAGMTTTCKEEAVSIKWTTESEHNNDYFRIEKSTNGSTWDILGYVDAVGNSSVLNGYEYLDLESRSNTYYRLYQVDQDGSEELLSTLYSDCDAETSEIASFPNPSNETLSIYWKQFNTTGDGIITIRDINGKTMYREIVKLSLGANLFMIKAHLTPGVYIIELMDDNYERRLMKHVVK
jgi:hypothetical protein